MSLSDQQIRAFLREFASYLHKGDMVRVIEEDNSSSRAVPFAEAVDKDLPFFITVRDDVLALDFDMTDGDIRALEFAQQFGQHPSLVCDSGGPGRAHLYLLVKNPASRNKIKDYAKSHGLYVRRDIRPPYGKHRDGQNRSLPVGNQLGLFVDEVFSNRRTLDQEIEFRLEVGWPVGQRSEGLFWLAAVLINRGASEAEYIEAVLAHPEGAGEKVAKLSHPKAIRYLKEIFKKAAQSAEVKVGIRGDRVTLSRWLESISNAHPDQYIHDFSVLVAIAKICIRSSRVEVDLSVREVAELAGCGKSTVCRVIDWLRANKYLALSARETRRARKSRRFRLSGFSGHTLINTPPNLTISVSDEFDDLFDAFFRQSIKRSLYLIIAVYGGQFLNEILERVPEKRHRYHEHLKRMEEVGLIGWADGEWICIGDLAAIERISEIRGTVGVTELRKQRHREDRERYRPDLNA